MVKRKIPLIKHEETLPAALRQKFSAGEVKKLEEVQETEQLMGGIAFLEEEIRSLYDTVAEGLDYIDLEDTGLLTDQNIDESLRQNLLKHRSENGENRLLIADIKALMKDKEGISSLLKALLSHYHKVFAGVLEENLLGPEGRGTKIELQVNRLAWAKLVGLREVILMIRKREAELADLKIDPTRMQQVEILRAHTRRKLKQKVKRLTNVKAPIELANATREAALLRTSGETATLTGVTEESVEELDLLMADAAEQILGLNAERSLHLLEARGAFEEEGNLVNTDFLSAYVNYHREMVNMYRMLEKGRIVETDYIRDIINRAMPIIRQDPPGVLYLHGDFGSGKTALAIHICKTKLGKEPIIVSGNKYLEPDRFTEEFRIKKADERDFYDLIFRKYELEEKISQSEDMVSVNAKVERAKEQIAEKIIQKREKDEAKGLTAAEKKRIVAHVEGIFDNKVEGQYVLGAMYQAKREGRPLIIDEANAITPDVLIAFNDLLTKKHGDIVSTRTHFGDIEQKEGYCIIWTGNTGERYKNQARYELDPAAFSRVEGIRMEYLPNSKESSAQAALMERITLEQGGESIADAVLKDGPQGPDVTGLIGNSGPLTYEELKKRAKQDQIFQVLLCKLLNRRLGSMLIVREEEPYSVFKELYKLGMVARNVMDIFEGKYRGSLIGNNNLKTMIGGSATAPEITKTLQKTNLTMRALIDRIVGRFKNEGMILDLEYYSFRFVQAMAERPEELVIVYKEFQANGFFREADGWPNPDEFLITQPKSASTRENAQAFASMISGFDPLKVSKYTDVQMNGDHFSFMKIPTGKTKSTEKLAYRYFTTLETMQLMYGLLPPRRLAEYQEMADEMKGLNQDSDLEKITELLPKMSEIIENTTGKNGVELLKIVFALEKTSRSGQPAVLKEITDEMKRLASLPDIYQVNNLATVRTMTMEEFEGKVNLYLEELLQLLQKTAVITQQEAEVLADLSVPERADKVAHLVKDILSNN